MTGPYETQAEAHAAAVSLYGPPRAGWLILSAEQNREMITAACEAAGVELGDYDATILAWLAGYEDAMCAVVAGLITRACAAGREGSGPPAGQGGPCPLCGAGALRVAWTGTDGPGEPRDVWQCTGCDHEWSTPREEDGTDG